ncbi:sister chromatid cohesion protein PDS5 homolog A-like isoform X2 [Prosopis cineraria]|uniref:sister chromatid cohesion protein PDS5 homolog A-like isoform X2 n=1 Tax=Prosopis cineraria TaxID=364024 RepID=UPI00240FAA3E|nr:sister chromatid cohesion protein PDS5 homolog A-like isoform X2 [Prosopis cineraria]
MALKPQQQLNELGSKLDILPATKDGLIKLLKQAAACLIELDQSPSTSTMESLKPFLNSIIKPELLKHQDRDVKLLVAACACEITRITAPEAPYSDDVLKDIFQLIVGTFSGLSDTSGPSFGRRVVILETLAKYRSCVVMLDLECDDLVNEMFSTFFAAARDDHPETVLSSMQTIMVVLLEESEDVQEDLLCTILSTLGQRKNGVSKAARRLAMNVIQQCAGKLEPCIKQYVLSLMSGDSKPMDSQVQYHGVIYDLYCCAPQVLSGILPYVTGELLTDQLETRLKAVSLVGDIISRPGSSIPEVFLPIFSEFLKRLTDRVVEVRMSVLEYVKSCLLSDPVRAEAPQLISALCDRLLDFDETVRKQVVAVICDVACHSVNTIPLETVKLVAERLRDKSLLVKGYTLDRLAEVYRVFCEKSSVSSVNPNEFDWIPGKILRCFYDRDFRSDIIEFVLCESLFPAQYSINDIVKHWVGIFSGLDKVELKALEKVLEQRQRLQQEMQKYLSFRQMSQDKDVPEIQKKVLFCFRVMSRSFVDPAKAEESFQILDQLKDANIWKILTNLVDPNTSLHEAHANRDDLLKILGEKHRLYDFLKNFSVKCSYLLFNKEHVQAILSEIFAKKSSDNAEYIQSCMNILVIIARYCPLLLHGSEEELVCLLKDSNEMIIEGVLHILAKAGGTVREQLAVTSSSVDLILERLCLEGSRRQAKYAVHALAAITKDDGLKSLSVLYKRLVDMLEKKTHLPAVLQSLGCIAQTAMPVFETRESEVEEYVINKILKSDSKDDAGVSWDDRSDLCMLKIYGIKALVKSYLPVKDAHVRSGIDGLLDILKNMLTYGEISSDIQSSSVDKAHLRLASAKAILRLSRQWDHKIPVGLFYLTLGTSKINFPQAKKIFLSKVHQYLKDRLLDAKYSCAIILSIFESKEDEFAEGKQNLADIIQMLQQTKAREQSLQSDANSTVTYPEYILPYLVHALAHNTCPNVDECKDVETYDNIYRQLHLILSILLHKDEDAKSETTNNKEKENISTITDIFQSIKHSEDIVDSSKSKSSHAICDLGVAITKRLVQKDVDLEGLSTSVSLPSMLYKACEKKEDDFSVSEMKTWLVDESVLSHFESLELEMVPSELADDVLKDNERDGSEVPLGKMIKHIKSQGTKRKKVKKSKSVPGEMEKAENDIDILRMVRQINLDNLGMSSKFESSNGHEDPLGKKMKKDSADAMTKKRKSSEETPIQVPKRKRSSSTPGSFRSSNGPSKASLTVSEDSPEAKLPSDAEIIPDTDSKTKKRRKVKGSKPGLLVSPLKQRVSDSYHDDEDFKSDEPDLKNTDKLKKTDKTSSSNTKSSTGSFKKKKRKSIAGLSRCTTKEGEVDTEDLISCRIKVWWPMDKQFYEGTVKSYDSQKGKHVILYDDGDVEVLRLEKERWELIDKGRKSAKKIKSSKNLSSHQVSSGQKHKSSGGSQSKKSKKLINGEQSSRKNVKLGEKGKSNSNFHREDIKESSDTTMTSKADETDSGDFEGRQGELSDEVIRHVNKGKEKVKNVSSGNKLQKKKASSYMEEDPDEEKQEFDERLSEDRETVPQGVKNVEESGSDGREVDESSVAMREKANGEAEADSEVEESSPQEMDRAHKKSSSLDGVGNAEISEDEPLSKWKPRTGKRSSGQKR